MTAPGGGPLLAVEGLTVGFRGEGGFARVVEDVSFDLRAGEVLGLVGESGCGKSVTAMSVMRLLPSPPSRVEAGRIRLEGASLLDLDERAMRAVRGDRIGMVFQEPMTSLNPTLTVGFQLVESLRLHRRVGAAEARERALDMLARVGVSAPSRRMAQYPHELSGGLRQRVLIAMALICRPALLVADEPTTALDVTIQAQILDLLLDLKEAMGMGVLLITHDLGVVAETCERVVVMYAGRVVESAPVRALFRETRHPYTRGLMLSTPRIDAPRGRTLPTIPGMVPSPGRRAAGCRFAERCDRALARCRREDPPLGGTDAHRFACWNPAA